MSDSDGSPQRDDRHHRRSRSRSPVSPGYAGETLAEREERRLAEAALPVRPLAGQPRAAPRRPEPSTQEPAPIEVTTPAAQYANPAALPPEGTPGAQRAETADQAGHTTAPTDHAAAPGTPPARGVAPVGALSASTGAAAAAAGGREGGSTAPTPIPAAPTPAHTIRTPSRLPSLRGGSGLSAPRCPSVRRQASCCCSCSGSRTPGA